jgi:DNA polymerase III delta prime subunit
LLAGENGQLVPVKYPDPQKLSELPGYEKEREKVIANTKALLAGMPANNVLLYGDAGTGKSSAVKAIANEFAPEGLRLVEVKKNQLYQIPDLMDKLAANPLKFILFIDDLSFTANDDTFPTDFFHRPHFFTQRFGRMERKNIRCTAIQKITSESSVETFLQTGCERQRDLPR